MVSSDRDERVAAVTSPIATLYSLLRLARQDDVLHDRIDLVLPPLAAEHAIMADARLHVVALEIGPQARAQVVRGERLADCADVVALAFHGEQHGAPNRARLHWPAAPVEPSERQGVFLKHEADSLEIEFGRQVEHREIFVVERLNGLRGFIPA